ncbi:hypothetical protein GCM10023322_37940 [Rugosimonospora acidiphila]|uniref:Uncharacterized protein n=1 Tax=Rugosimonospora acidiphila TaxID=556531 RepID=A0ABP9RXV8_9ACTN
MSLSTRNGEARTSGAESPDAAPLEASAEAGPAADGSRAAAPVAPMPAVPGLVVLAGDDAPMCSDGVCL